MSVLLFGATSLWGQGSGKLTGKILSIKNQPVSGAIVTVLDTVNVTTSKIIITVYQCIIYNLVQI